MGAICFAILPPMARWGFQEPKKPVHSWACCVHFKFFTCPFLKLSFPWAKWSPSRSRSRGRGLFESLERPASRASGASRGGTAPIFRKVAPSREVRARARELFSLVDDAISRYKDQALRRSPLPRFFFSFFFFLLFVLCTAPVVYLRRKLVDSGVPAFGKAVMSNVSFNLG